MNWAQVSGRGTVYTFAICHQAFSGFFRDKVPYNLALVELDDIPGIRMVSNIVGCANEDLYIGMPVEVVWEDITEEITLYFFQPTAT